MFKTRPIVVGSLLYRSWAKLRFAEIAKMLGRILLGPLQAGGLPTHDAETLLLSFTEEFTTSSHPFGISLDYAKAFDSSDHEVASALLNRAGVPGGVMRALTAIWKHHDRGLAMEGCQSLALNSNTQSRSHKLRVRVGAVLQVTVEGSRQP